ncbi:MAG: hypothetical protein ABWY93_17940 [Mycobacterium sp.]
MNKLMIGSIAALGASVIAVNPIAPSTAALEIQHRAVQLVADVTGSPAAVYEELFTNTVTSLNGLGAQISANPLPILSALLANQEGYATKVGNAFTAAGTAFDTWWNVGTRESPAGKVLLENIQAAISVGDFGVAYDNFNKLALFGIQNTVLPILNGTIFTSGTNLGIPQQMAQNFADAIGAVLNTGTIAFGAFASIYAPLSGAAFEGSRALGDFATALSTGNVEGAVNALINTPGVVADAFLNGFDYNEGDATLPWVGLLSPVSTSPVRPTQGGPFQQFLVTIPKKIAAAIINTPVTPTATVAAAPSTAAITAAPTESAKVQTFDLKVTDDTADTAAAVATGVTETEADDTTAVAKPTTAKPSTATFTDRLDAAVKKATKVSSDDSSGSKAGSTKSASKKSSGKHAK